MSQILLTRWTFFDQTRAPTAMTWKKPGQRFDFGFTGKNNHEGTRGDADHFMAVIIYRNVVIAVEQYHGRINTEVFSSFFCEHFYQHF